MNEAGKKLHMGTSGWSYKDWRGVFYPQGQKSVDYLSFYAQKMDSVEIDSTFYGIPRASTVENWFKVTPDHFLFCPKAPQQITHKKRLQNCGEEWRIFLDRMRLLKHKLGPVVMQFEYKFKFAEYFETLESFLREAEFGETKLCIEVRDKNWYQPAAFDLLRQHNVALVLSDLYYMPRISEITADFTYIRLLGNRHRIPDDFSRVRLNRDKDFDFWSEKINGFLDKNLEVYVYSNNRYQGHAPSTIDSLKKRIPI